MTTKVPDTKGCLRCCVGRNPYNGYKYLCGAMPNSVFLMQWYDPLNKFMLLKVWDIVIMTEGLNGLQSSLPSSASWHHRLCVVAGQLDEACHLVRMRKGL